MERERLPDTDRCLSSETSFEDACHWQKQELQVRDLATNGTMDRRLKQVGRTGDKDRSRGF